MAARETRWARRFVLVEAISDLVAVCNQLSAERAANEEISAAMRVASEVRVMWWYSVIHVMNPLITLSA